MLYQGQCMALHPLDGGYAELRMDNQSASVNKFNQETLQELSDVTKVIAGSDIKGLVLSSAKAVFNVGADITEFGDIWAGSEQGILDNLAETNAIFSAFEDLDVPKVAAINGIALGGGFEACLACEYRVMSNRAKVGLPETSLGLFPGFGGTVRLSRLIGVDNAVQWIAAGKDRRAAAALSDGAVDAVVAPDHVFEAALALVQDCANGDFDWRAKRQEKLDPIALNDIERLMSFTTCKAMVTQQAGRNMPAPMAAVEVIEAGATLSRDEAIVLESQGFARMVNTPQCDALVGIFLSDQLLAKKAKTVAAFAGKVDKAGVLGAGIMGGGIAYQSASTGTAIAMKDINQDGIDLGLSEANKLLAKQLERGKISPQQMGETLNRINPTLSYDDLEGADIVVEAVVENAKVKGIVLAEVEDALASDAILTSNTSTISITSLAKSLKRPENFCGMHFFNPVHAMPLVEVIRGEKSSDAAIAKTTAYALSLGKKPVIVNDCPGFLVNRVLFPYFAGFAALLRDGADFQQVDRVMEKWGWPMGPAYLNDVVGIDTGVHASDVLAEGFPDRMAKEFKDATTVMFEADRYGQKNGKGFYVYQTDKRGKPKKVVDDETYALLEPHVGPRREFDEQEIIDRMMIPMCTELARCVEEGVVASVAEADMALIYGVGFPVFRGGVFRWMDAVGVSTLLERMKQYESLGALYQPTEAMQAMADASQSYYQG